MRVSLIVLVLASLLLTNFIVIADQDISYKIEGDSNLSIISDNKLVQDKINEIIHESPMIFTENRGQLENEQVRYYVNNGLVWFTDDGVWFEIIEYTEPRGQGSEARGQGDFDPQKRFEPSEPVEYNRVILKQEFVGANLARPLGREMASWNSNFFYGNDSSKWYSNVPNYMEVYYENLYDGIDLRYYTNEKGLKYDFIVHPWADVDQIRLKYEGGDGLEINELGNLIIKTGIEEVIEEDPVIYQNRYWGRAFIKGGFIKFNKDEYGFKLFEDYSKEKILVIDPQIELEYSTFIGGSLEDLGYGIAVDSQGNAYISGRTKSTKYPTTPGANETQYIGSYDVVITKLNSIGSSLLYSTYLGGTDNDYGNGIAIDSNGNAYVTGRTWSSDFPVTSGAYITSYNSHWDIFVTKLNAVGSMLDYSTYMGHNNADYGMAIAVDLSGNAYVTGYTHSHLFPITPGAFDDSYNQYTDGYVFKLNNNGSKLLYSTYIGGNNFDYAYDIKVDNLGDAFIVGSTRSTNFPYTSNAYDINLDGNSDSFICRLNKNASKLNYSTFLGGSSTEIGYGIAIDTTGNAYVTGHTNSINFPNINAYDKSHNGGRDIFVSKLATNRSKLFYSTYLGGTNTDEGRGITVDNLGNAFVTGETSSTDFNITSDAYDSILNGSRDAFLLKFNSNGSKLMHSTYLGGSSYETGYRIALDPNSNAYIAGGTYSSDFPITPVAFNKSYMGAGDIFVSKFSFQPILSITSLSLFENNQTTSTIYSKLCPYNFRVKVIDSVSINDLEKVYLTLDPEGSNIQLSWDRATGQFLELSDSQNYVSINSSSKGYNYYNIWTIDFNLELNWNYPDEELHNVQTIATSATLSPSWFNVTGFYYVENDIVFEGESIIRNEENRILAQNELVRGGEKLTWMGLTPVYEGTIDVYPPEDEFNIAICDDYDNTWVCSPNSSEQFYSEIFTPNTTFSSYNYTLSICGIPPECDNTSEMFTLRIDADNLTFSEIVPNEISWQTLDDVTIGVTISDIGGGVVNSSTVMYAISRNNGSSWDKWETVPNLDSAISIEIKDIVALMEGKNNLIIWKAADSVGNGPIESEPSRILVDTEGISFYNAWPSATAVSTSELVELGITVADGISGANASTIKYSISTDKGITWDPWVPVEGYEDSIKIDIHINLTVPNGTNNMIKWRATDVAGNTPIESPPYTINVNTWTPAIKPVVRLVSPLNAMVITDTEVELIWELEDTTLKDVKYDLCLEKVNPPEEYQVGLMNTSLNVSKLLDGMTYYWRIVSRYGDDLRNTYKSDVWWFNVDLGDKDKEEIFKLKITGTDRLSMKQGENKTVQISITNLGNSDDRVDLELQTGILYGFVEFGDYSVLEIGKNGVKQVDLKINLPITVPVEEYRIVIIANSLNSVTKVSANYTIILDVQPLEIEPPDIDNDDQDKSSQGLYLILLAALVIIIIIVGVFLFYYNRNKQKEQELQAGRTITTKPLPSQVINVGELPQPQGPQVAAIPPQQPVPIVIAAGTQPQPQALTTPSPTVAPQPTLAQTSQVTPVPQVVQATQVPQLPPAKTETQTTQYDSVDVPGGEVTVPTQMVPEPTQAQETQATQMSDTPATFSQQNIPTTENVDVKGSQPSPTIGSEQQKSQESQNQKPTIPPTVSLPGQTQTSNQVHLPEGTGPGEIQEQKSPTSKEHNSPEDA